MKMKVNDLRNGMIIKYLEKYLQAVAIFLMAYPALPGFIFYISLKFFEYVLYLNCNHKTDIICTRTKHFQ